MLDIQEDLQNKKYRPKPVKRVYILESDGKQRPLGIMKDRIVQQATEKGSPQGRVISLLLADIYLYVLDSYCENHKELGTIVRYADDAVIVCRTRRDAEIAYEHLKRIMARLKLTLIRREQR